MIHIQATRDQNEIAATEVTKVIKSFTHKKFHA